ncbi:MAG: ribonuclease P protein component [Chitinophagaceae bacterium]|jgi:ribonuclease P protein component|nr:ribonuclease P protein component [Chitinophagaceae bacterium]
MKQFSYGRIEKLKSKKQIEGLFAKGKSFNVFPLRVFYNLASAENNFPVKAAVGVSKRHFKKAVDRNRIKRLLREAYRTEKNELHVFLKNKNTNIVVFISYTDKELPEYNLVKSKVKYALQRLVKLLNENVITGA